MKRSPTTRRLLWLFVIVGIAATDCIRLQSPHDNFMDIMGRRVGQNINDPHLLRAGFADPRFLLSVKELAAGHKELEYRHRGACSYFFEVDEKGTIVAWHYKGPDTDCIIVP